MKTYIKNYRYRLSSIILTIAISFSTMLLSLLLFGNKMNSLNNQLKNYQDSEFEIAYILNYSITEVNEFIYADTDIQLFSNAEGIERIAASCLMPQVGTEYNLKELDFISGIKDNEIILTENVAQKYNLKIGDTVYVQYPYSSKLYELTIRRISETQYEFENPNISNDIGIAYVGYNENYVRNTNCKYILFCRESQTELLSKYPQVLSGLINKSQNKSFVFEQGVHILIFETIFIVFAMILVNLLFFSKSFEPLRRIYIKGSPRSILVKIPFWERIILWGIPCGVSLLINNIVLPCNSELTKYYYFIPLFMSLLFLIISTIHDFIKTH